MKNVFVLNFTLKNVVLCVLFQQDMKSDLSSKTGIFFIKIISHFPFWMIYLLSDILFLLVFYGIGYRKKVVSENLRNSFPDKSEKEIKKIRRKFFRHLADLTLETLKMNGMDERDYQKRYKVKNPGLLNAYFEKGQSVVVLTSHFNNWEWGNVFPLVLKHRILGVYKPFHNVVFDAFQKKTRSKFGAELVPDAKILRRVITAEKNNEPVFTWLAGDQNPPFSKKFWFRFLNQDTIFFPGPAVISRKFNHPVIFQETKKVARGKYEVTFDVLFEDPGEQEDSAIILAFIKKMEALIVEKPEHYLWSHRRWKHQRPPEVPLNN